MTTIFTDFQSEDDDQIETTLSVRFRNLSHAELQSPEGSPGAINLRLENEQNVEHGLDLEGKPACCRKESDGLTDCQGCLEVERSSLLAGLTRQDNVLVQSILNAVHQAGTKGIEKDNLLVRENQLVVISLNQLFSRRLL